LRLLIHNLSWLEHVSVVRIRELIKYDVHLSLRETLLEEEVLDLVVVHAHIAESSHELLSEGAEVVRDGDCSWVGLSHGHRLLDLLALSIRASVGRDVVLSEEVEQLRWHLHQGLLREEVRVVLEVIEGHKLDDISSHVLAVGLRVESLFVSIEDLHGLEVGVTDSDNDDGDGELGSTDYLVDCLVHIIDNTIGDDHTDVELLSVLAHRLSLSIVINGLEDLREVSWPVKIDVLDGILVAVDHLVEAVDSGIEDISIESEAMRGSIVVGWDGSAEAIQIDVLVSVVELKDVADRLNGLEILVPLRIKVMERVRRGWTAI